MGVQHLHRKNIIHRDIKLENIVFTCVVNILLRVWQKYVISVGQSMPLKISGQPSVELPFTFPLKFSKEKSIMTKLISGPLVLLVTKWPQERTLLGSRINSNWEK